MKTANAFFSQTSPEDLQRQIARAGPGYRGEREPPNADALQAIKDQLGASKVEVPVFFERETDWIDRRAKLFEAGEYPDKGVTVTVEQLAEIAARFDLPVPVWIEHADSPLELGYLTQVAVEGGELFGNIALTQEADALVRRSGAKSLSIGLSPDLQEIREVSLVKSPRVASAQLFSCGYLDDERRWERSYDGIRHNMQMDWKAKFEALQAKQKNESAQQTVERFIAEGRMLPAEATFAKALLVATDAIEFDGESQPISQLFVAMIEKRIPHGLFGEIAPNSTGEQPNTMLPEEAEFYRKHFPDVGLDQIANIKRTGAA